MNIADVGGGTGNRGTSAEQRAHDEINCQDAATLLDILIDGFEKNESLGEFHWRELPMRGDGAAARELMP